MRSKILIVAGIAACISLLAINYPVGNKEPVVIPQEEEKIETRHAFAVGISSCEFETADGNLWEYGDYEFQKGVNYEIVFNTRKTAELEDDIPVWVEVIVDEP